MIAAKTNWPHLTCIYILCCLGREHNNTWCICSLQPEDLSHLDAGAFRQLCLYGWPCHMGFSCHPVLSWGLRLPASAQQGLLGWGVQLCRWPLPVSGLSQPKSRAARTVWGPIWSSPFPSLHSLCMNTRLPRLDKMILTTQCDAMCSLGEGGESVAPKSSPWACHKQETWCQRSCSVWTPMGSIRRGLMREKFGSLGQAGLGPAWRQRYRVRWRSGEVDLKSSPVFIASILLSQNAADHREGRNAATGCFWGT